MCLIKFYKYLESNMRWDYNNDYNIEEDFYSKKKEFAAAVISNCGAGSKRLEYIKGLF